MTSISSSIPVPGNSAPAEPQSAGAAVSSNQAQAVEIAFDTPASQTSPPQSDRPTLPPPQTSSKMSFPDLMMRIAQLIKETKDLDSETSIKQLEESQAKTEAIQKSSVEAILQAGRDAAAATAATVKEAAAGFWNKIASAIGGVLLVVAAVTLTVATAGAGGVVAGAVFGALVAGPMVLAGASQVVDGVIGAINCQRLQNDPDAKLLQPLGNLIERIVLEIKYSDELKEIRAAREAGDDELADKLQLELDIKSADDKLIINFALVGGMLNPGTWGEIERSLQLTKNKAELQDALAKGDDLKLQQILTDIEKKVADTMLIGTIVCGVVMLAAGAGAAQSDVFRQALQAATTTATSVANVASPLMTIATSSVEIGVLAPLRETIADSNLASSTQKALFDRLQADRMNTSDITDELIKRLEELLNDMRQMFADVSDMLTGISETSELITANKSYA